MKRVNLILVLLLAGFFTGCAPSIVRYAYITPGGACGYRVYIKSPMGFDGNVPLSTCMPLEDAWNLANQINKDMAGKWSAEKE